MDGSGGGGVGGEFKCGGDELKWRRDELKSGGSSG